ncbi:DnaB-like helicase C-terminal domain-containing protein [Ochrobactrum sp. SFR4]|uniref:DnaB-like helicase C-terminal domain-containing protein n=1 Tax=Ochrobactrum sp. SFR4 TaxID=2717368 RepID=UPI001C8B4165|nr:DnaB-like helicase C-terminal domain-containing protein [Ochrobactrum sp. SFR4]MBX8825264.1 hypothetical protein [Ochrobactrum sp. SFR4]
MTYHQPNIEPKLPDAIEHEQYLLGSIFLDNTSYWRVAGFLRPEHFSDPRHADVYAKAAKMISEGRTANPITLKPYINAELKISDELNLYQYLIRLSSEAVGNMSVYDWGRGILEVWSRRQIYMLAQSLIDQTVSMPIDTSPAKLIAGAADRLTEISREGDERAGSMKYGVLLPKAIERVAKASLEQNTLIPWFLPEITQVAGEIRRGNLIGFMSDSGGGKTSFSLQQCRHAATAGFKSAFFSIEITDEEAALQAAAQASRISLGRLDSYSLNTKEQGSIETELLKSMNLPFDIVAFSDCTLSDIRIKMEAMKRSAGLDLVIIDHAKMINLPGKSNELFAERVNALYRGLKALAKSLDVAIVILIQRNEEWKGRWKAKGNIRPMMGDAYGGGGVKQNLDVWFSLYRPEPLYKELIPQEMHQERKDELIRKYDASRGKAAVINHKRRRGEPNQDAQILFDAEYTVFRSPQEETAQAAFDAMF